MDANWSFGWLWGALRGRSVTFAVLFACGIFGLSVTGWLRHLLREWGVGWMVGLLIPSILVILLARKEREWIPSEETRRKWARGLIVGSILGAIVMAKLMPDPPRPESELKPWRKIGPRGK